MDERAYNKLHILISEASSGSAEAFEFLHKLYDEGNGNRWDDETILNHAKKNLIYLVISKYFKGE